MKRKREIANRTITLREKNGSSRIYWLAKVIKEGLLRGGLSLQSAPQKGSLSGSSG